MSKITFLGIDFKPGSFDRYVAMDKDRQLYTYAINSQAGIHINHSHNIWSLRYNGEYTCQGRVSEVFKLPWELSLVSLKELTEPSDLDITEDNVGDVFMCRDGSIATIQRIESTNPSKVHVEEVGTIYNRDGSFLKGRVLGVDLVKLIKKYDPIDHIHHIEERKQYAEDWLETNTPWERWEFRNPPEKIYYGLHTHPEWKSGAEYRRKASFRDVLGYLVPEPWRNPPPDSTAWLADPTRKDWVFEVEEFDPESSHHILLRDRNLLFRTKDAAMENAKAMAGKHPKLEP